MLAFDVNGRISVVEALRHPYLRFYHDPDDEPASDTCVDLTHCENVNNLPEMKRECKYCVV